MCPCVGNFAHQGSQQEAHWAALLPQQMWHLLFGFWKGMLAWFSRQTPGVACQGRDAEDT